MSCLCQLDSKCFYPFSIYDEKYTRRDERICRQCNSLFHTRNELFRHLGIMNHYTDCVSVKKSQKQNANKYLALGVMFVGCITYYPLK
jgi:hypothetical protein